MTHFVSGTAEMPARTKDMRAARPGRPSRAVSERRVFINAPIEEVLRHAGNSTFGERLPGAGDPAFRREIHELGRGIDVNYTLYEIPGGTQISALIQRSRPAVIHPLETVGAEAAQRKVDAQLHQIKDELE